MKSLLAFVIVAAIAIRISGVATPPIWFDEQMSLMEANGITYSPAFLNTAEFTHADFNAEKKIANAITANVGRDSGNGILYTAGLYLWTSLFGNATITVRLLSVIFSALSILVVYRLTLLLMPEGNAAMIAAFFLSIHHMSVLSAVEARPYALAILLVSLSTYLFYRICTLSGSPLIAIGYGVVSGLALLAHYFSFSILLSQIIIAIVFFRSAIVWKKLLTGAVVTLAIVAVWMFVGGIEGLEIMARRNLEFQAMTLAYPDHSLYGKTSPQKLVTGFLQMCTHILGIGFQYGGFRVREALVFLLVPLLLVWTNRKVIGARSHTLLQLSLMIIVMPVISLVLAIRSGHMISFQGVYANFAVPFAAILFGIIFGTTFSEKKILTSVLWISYLAILGTSVWLALSKGRTIRSENVSDYSATAREIESAYVPGTTVIFHSFDEAVLNNLYFTNPNIIQRIDSSALSTKP